MQDESRGFGGRVFYELLEWPSSLRHVIDRERLIAEPFEGALLLTLVMYLRAVTPGVITLNEFLGHHFL